jgi:hypothetical protein
LQVRSTKQRSFWKRMGEDNINGKGCGKSPPSFIIVVNLWKGIAQAFRVPMAVFETTRLTSHRASEV